MAYMWEVKKKSTQLPENKTEEISQNQLFGDNLFRYCISGMISETICQ